MGRTGGSQMPTFFSQMFFLGNVADIDTDENNFASEGSADILGTYIQPELINVNVNDQNGDNEISDDESGTFAGEAVSYDTGGGPTTQFIDSTIVYTIRVTLGDNSTVNMLATVIQLQNGDVFLTDFANNGSLDNLNVQNIELLSVVEDSYAGFWADSSVDGSQTVCFVSGTPIMTRGGLMPVQDVVKGTTVLTMDNGFQACTGVTFDSQFKPGTQNAPICISAGALGDGVPTRPLRLSPQHRIPISSLVAERMFGAREVLVRTKYLLILDGVTQALPFLPVQYHHILCKNHEIICAGGVWAESLLSGAEALNVLKHKSKIDMAPSAMAPARQIVQGRRARKLLERHNRNCAPRGKPFSPRPVLSLNAGVSTLTREDTFKPARLVQ